MERRVGSQEQITIKCYSDILKSFQDTLVKGFERLVKMSNLLSIGNTN